MRQVFLQDPDRVQTEDAQWSKSDMIKTDRLRLVPYSQRYVTDEYVSWLNDPDVVRYSEQRHKVHTLDSCSAYLAAMQADKNYFWAIVTNKDRHIGNLTAYVDRNNNIADMAIMLGDKSSWGCGYATDAWIAASRFLLYKDGFRKVTCGTLACNTPMRRLMNRSGMVPDGRRLGHYLWHGQAVDVVYGAFFSA